MNNLCRRLSISWGIDNNHDSDYSKNLTIQWCISAEPLNHSAQLEYGHCDVLVLRELAGPTSVHHNIYATGRRHHPTLGATVDGRLFINFRNNLIYNWTGTVNFGDDEIVAINNYFKPGPETDDQLPIAMEPARSRDYRAVIPRGKRNVDARSRAHDFNRWLRPGSKYKYEGKLADWKLAKPRDLGVYTPHTETAPVAYKQILAQASSHQRDAVDERIIADIRNGTGRVIDSQEQVGGWPRLPFQYSAAGHGSRWDVR